MRKHLLLSLLSALMLSAGWLSLSGIPLLGALVPLMLIADDYGTGRRPFWKLAGWTALTLGLWSAATTWWIWYAAAIGAVLSVLITAGLMGGLFMLWHGISLRAGRPLSCTVLVSGWIACEYLYTVGQVSFPWLTLGNGFACDPWLVQWYEYTGVFGGSLWVLAANILLFEALRAPRRAGRWIAAAVVLFVPMIVSGLLYATYRQPDEGSVRVAIVQPDVDVYAKFHGDDAWQERNIVDLISEVPSGAQFIVLPETAVPGYYWEPQLGAAKYFADVRGPFWTELRDSLRAAHPEALLVTGANTNRAYRPELRSRTARKDRDGGWYDHFNTAVGLDSAGRIQLHHKGRLVIGAEKTPLPRLFEWLDFLVIDLGGTLGQLGVGQHGTAFEHDGVRVGPAICYEGLYGDFYGGFVRRGAQAMFIISNDGWWGDTPGYKHLFSISRLRAVEHRRAIARSANTGMSGFIDARGDVGPTLGWDERGVLTDEVRLRSSETVYTRYGDYLGRIAQYVMLLCVLYYVAYRFKKKNYLVS